jgi:hypothetical protein
MRLARSYVRSSAKGITPACCVVWWKRRHELSVWRRVQSIRCKPSRYTTQRNPSDENRGRTGEGRGEVGSGEMEMPPLDAKGHPPKHAQRHHPEQASFRWKGSWQMKRKQGRAENQSIRVCLCACVCVCGTQAPQPKASAASRGDVPPPHNMSGS